MSVEPECVTAGRPGPNQLLYFTSTSLEADDRHLVYLTERTGHPNLVRRDLATGEERLLTEHAEGRLQSYVYFDGQPERGFGKASVTLHAPSATVYYILGREVRAVGPAGPDRRVAVLPAGQVTAFTHVSDDGTRLCVPTTDARALEGGRRMPRPDYDIDRRCREENLSSYLRVYDTATGACVACEEVPRCWITHVSFAPGRTDRILYNHEWASDWGIRRMWILDGTQHTPVRTEGEGRKRSDWACHEFWLPGREEIVYHGGLDRGERKPCFVGLARMRTGERIEIPLPDDFIRYGHFTGGPEGLLVSDGYYERADDPEDGNPAGRWISLLAVDWNARRIEWIPLCRHGSSFFDSQDNHPHPIFDHAGRWVYFTSNRDGERHVWRIAVPERFHRAGRGAP